MRQMLADLVAGLQQALGIDTPTLLLILRGFALLMGVVSIVLIVFTIRMMRRPTRKIGRASCRERV